MQVSPKCSLSFKFSSQNFVCNSHLCYVFHALCIFSSFIWPKEISDAKFSSITALKMPASYYSAHNGTLKSSMCLDTNELMHFSKIILKNIQQYKAVTFFFF
jgi:hypothetical protein